MYPIYFEQFPTTYRRPQVSVDDYVQLQLMLRQEQAQREQAALHRKQQQEQRRLEKALYNLKVMTELQRQREQEERAIQAYYAAKRREQEAARQQYLRQKQEEAIYQALLEQEQERQLRALAQEQELLQAKSAEYADPYRALANAMSLTNEEEEESESESESEEVDTEAQLLSIIKMIFGEDATIHQDEDEDEDEHDEHDKQDEKDDQDDQDDQDEQDDQEQEPEQQTMSLDEFVNYISKKARELDSDEEDESTAAPENTSTTTNNDQDSVMEESDQDLSAEAFEHIDDNEDDDMDEDDAPVLVKSTESIHNLVNDILANTPEDEELSETPEDPVKIAKFDALQRIEQELDTISQEQEDQVLHVQLDFTHSTDGRPESPDSLSASTAENRRVLGYEDQLVKVLLKLDMIESDGDKQVRKQRKALVKRAEEMLNKLDEFKQREWERVSCSSHSEDEL